MRHTTNLCLPVDLTPASEINESSQLQSLGNSKRWELDQMQILIRFSLSNNSFKLEKLDIPERHWCVRARA